MNKKILVILSVLLLQLSSNIATATPAGIAIFTTVNLLISSNMYNDKIEVLKDEAALSLSALDSGREVVLSQELRAFIDDLKTENQNFADATDEEVLEAIILAE